MTNETAPRIVIIGLDGADWTLLRALFADGVMPTLKAFVEGGVSATLESVRPTNSMSAWTSFLTGVNPGKHGVFDFVRGTRTPFRTLVTNSTSIRFPTIPETLGGHGLSSCFIDMPPLYPPFPINGVMLGGIGAVTPAGRAYAWPSDVAAKVERAVGEFLPDVAWVGKAGRQPEVVADLIRMVENRQRVAEALLADRPVDLFCVVIVAPDRIQHILYQDLTEQGPQYPLARKFYAALDESLARLLERIDLTITDVLMVSDHGFRRLDKTFNVNQFFVDLGLTRWKSWSPLTARVLRRARRALTPFSGQIDRMLMRPRYKPRRQLIPDSLVYSDIVDSASVNLEGRESTGTVPRARFDEVRDRVAAKLLEFRDPETGSQVVEATIRSEDYFHGECAGEAPDMLLEYHDGYSYGSNVNTVLFNWGYCQGVHSLDGIMAAQGPHFRRNAQVPPVSILDVAPTVLSLLGVPSPEGTDGRVAEELLTGAPAATGGPPAPSSERRREPSAYSEEEEELVRERLRGLGYLE